MLLTAFTWGCYLGCTALKGGLPLPLTPQDAEFKKYVEVYAKDKKKFFDDFTVAFQKLEELGTKNLVPVA